MLEQILYRAKGTSKCAQIFIDRPIGDAEDGVLCRPVQVGALFPLKRGLHFQALQPLSFLLIFTLHWCKYCTGLEVPPNVRKFALTVLYAAMQKTAYFAGPSRSVRFFYRNVVYIFRLYNPLASFSYMLLALVQTLYRARGTSECAQICIDRPICGDAEDGVFCRPVKVGAFFLPKRGLHFQALQSLSFLFIYAPCIGANIVPG